MWGVKRGIFMGDLSFLAVSSLISGKKARFRVRKRYQSLFNPTQIERGVLPRHRLFETLHDPGLLPDRQIGIHLRQCGRIAAPNRLRQILLRLDGVMCEDSQYGPSVEDHLVVRVRPSGPLQCRESPPKVAKAGHAAGVTATLLGAERSGRGLRLKHGI